MLGESSPSGHDQGDKEKELEDSEHVQNFSQSVDEWTSGQEDKRTRGRLRLHVPDTREVLHRARPKPE